MNTPSSDDLECLTLFEHIARERCGIPTLRLRGRDALDFHEISVSGLIDMLRAAYNAGIADRKEAL